ncbi:DUF2845 domain-containing protein [Kaarinaea lacus]
MKITALSLALLLLVAINPVSYAETTLRCGSKLISVGDSKAQVLLKCGEPMLKETVGEKAQSKRIDIPLTSESSGGEADAPGVNGDPSVVRQRESTTKIIDHWTYNQGSGQLLKVLIFEGGELVEITTGNRIQ